MVDAGAKVSREANGGYGVLARAWPSSLFSYYVFYCLGHKSVVQESCVKNKQPAEVLEAPATGLNPSKDQTHAEGCPNTYHKAVSGSQSPFPEFTTCQAVGTHEIMRGLLQAHNEVELTFDTESESVKDVLRELFDARDAYKMS
jgi:hypothetical protein